MKKLLTLVTAALLFTGAYAHDGKDCGKGKKCTKEEMAKCKDAGKKACCKKEASASSVKVTKTTKPAPASKKA